MTFLRHSLSCQTKYNEVEGYRPFVYAFNHALRALHNVDVPLRKSTDLRLLFHQDDPKLMTPTHNSHLSNCKPDITLVFLDVAQDTISEGDTGSWAVHALKTATEPPKNSFKWSDSLSIGELRRNKCTLPSLPAQYIVKKVKEIPPQTIPNTIREMSEDRLTHEEGTWPSSEEAMQKPLNDAIQVSSKCYCKRFNCSLTSNQSDGLCWSERLASQPNVSRKAPSSSTSRASSSRKRKSDHGEGRSSKKAMTRPFTLKRPPGMLQSALYAAERMSRDLDQPHHQSSRHW